MENITNDDYIYTKNLIDAYVNGLISFPEFLEVAPSPLNLKSTLKIAKDGFNDKTIFTKLANMLINYYYNRLSEVKNFHEEKYFKKLLTVKEVLFLTDSDKIEKLVEGKEINLGEEIRSAFFKYKNELHPIYSDKVGGNAKCKLGVMISPYNSLFVKEKYLNNPSGLILQDGKISYVEEKFVDEVEALASNLELFPSRRPLECFVFETYKKNVLENQEPSL